MTTFAIIAPSARADLTAAVQRAFTGPWIEFAPGQFVANSQNLTVQGVVNELGGEGQVGQLVVFVVAGYWGFHVKPLWDWLSANGDFT